MSFYLGVWNTLTALSDDEAARQYVALSDETSAQSKFDSQVYAFYCRLTALYPEVEMVPEDELGACPWACSIDMPGSHVIMEIQVERSQEIVPQVMSLAEKHQLVCFDPQAGKVRLPPTLKLTKASAADGSAGAAAPPPGPTSDERIAASPEPVEG
jgi:hypothetical protein